MSRFWTIFPFFGAKKIILENLPQSGKTSYEFLAPSQNLEKSNNTIPKKMQTDRQKGEKKDRGTDRRVKRGTERGTDTISLTLLAFTRGTIVIVIIS